MSLSIFHRFTGLVLSLGTVLVLLWLIGLAGGPERYAYVQAFAGHWLGQLILAGWSLAFFYHLSNGVRHLLWDAGWGLEVDTARRTAGIVVVAAFLLTVVSWALAAGWLGGQA